MSEIPQAGAESGKGGEKSGLPTLIPQPHGGAIKTGGTPGQRGGTGRPRDELRRKLEQIANDPKALAAVREIAFDPDHQQCIRANVALWDKADEGLVPLDDIRERIRTQTRLILEMLGEDRAKPLLLRLYEVWS